jgi:hypothetical protein
MKALLGSYAWLAFFLMPGQLAAQALPESTVWMLELNGDMVSNPIRISSGPGYHNQPMFSPDGQSLYFTAERDGQTDIMRYNLAHKSLHVVLHSPESEYSPTPIPGQAALSVVRVELDQRQRLWRIPLDGGAPSLLLRDIESVGYHAWLDEDTVALFILGETFDLHIAKLSTGTSKRVAVNIGRTLRRHPQTGQLLFVDQNTEPWSIASHNPDSGKTTTVMALFPGVEDFEVDSKGRYWMGSGSKLYRSKRGGTGWALVEDLAALAIKDITRLAVEPRLATLIFASQ